MEFILCISALLDSHFLWRLSVCIVLESENALCMLVHFVVCEKQAYCSLHLCFAFFFLKTKQKIKKILPVGSIPFNLYQIQMSLSLSVSIEKKKIITLE